MAWRTLLLRTASCLLVSATCIRLNLGCTAVLGDNRLRIRRSTLAAASSQTHRLHEQHDDGRPCQQLFCEVENWFVGKHGDVETFELKGRLLAPIILAMVDCVKV